MPATMTAEYDLTGTIGATLYDKIRAALVASGAVVFDEYTSGGNYYLVERVLLAGQAAGYLRWVVAGTSLSSPTLFATWNPATRSGAALTGAQQGSSFSSIPYLRVYSGADYRLVCAFSAVTGSPVILGWMAPSTTPTGWNTATSPYIVGIGTLGSAFTVFTGSQNAALSRFSVSSPLLPTIDPALVGTIGRFLPFLGPGYNMHGWPEDFQAVSGRNASDFASFRDSEYNVMVGSETRTYRALIVTGGTAYVLRTT